MVAKGPAGEPVPASSLPVVETKTPYVAPSTQGSLVFEGTSVFGKHEPEHACVPLGQVAEQVGGSPVHAAAPPSSVAHAFAQDPQCAGSCASTQTPSQRMLPPSQDVPASGVASTEGGASAAAASAVQ